MALRKLVICLFLLSGAVQCLGRRPYSDLVTIESTLAGPLVEAAQKNAETYFENINAEYFQYHADEPVRVYLSMTLADARELINNHGNLTEAGDDFYVPSINALYVYLKENTDDEISWDNLFAGIADYLITKKFPDAPLWFRYGLSKSLSKDAQVDENELALPYLCPGESLFLQQQNEAEKSSQLSVKRFFIFTDEGFESKWQAGRPFSIVFFSWLRQKGKLKDFIANVYNDGCKGQTLTDTLSVDSLEAVNKELASFIENKCAIVANLAKAQQAESFQQKETLLMEVINSMLDNCQGRLALGRLYYENDKKQLCRQIIEPLLVYEDKISYMPAAKLAAACLYDRGDYTAALEYYNRVWERSNYYPYKYQIAYKIANCCNYLNRPNEAAKWYLDFIDLNWRAKDEPQAMEYAAKYVESFGN